jgi:hypothetical protein
MTTVEVDMNKWADFWRDEIGVNAHPAVTENKTTWVKWSQYQNSAISEEQHEQWKKERAFDKGIAIIAGKCWHAKGPAKKKLYLILVDCDNKKAIEEFCTRDGKLTPLEEVAKTIIVEQHDDDPNRAHFIFYASHPFKKKSSDTVNKTLVEKLDKNEIPAFEIKGAGEHGILYVSPSKHKNGHNYRIIGSKDLEGRIFDALETHLDNICNKYGIPYLTNNGNVVVGDDKQPINELFDEDNEVYAGHNRHLAVLRVMGSLLRRNKDILSKEKIRELAEEWNQKHCIPALEKKDMDRQWKAALNFLEQSSFDISTYPELSGNVYYQINEKPAKYIVAYRQKNQVIEVTVKTEDNKNAETLRKYIVHNKTYLACIPVKIIRHRSPLTFLEESTKYTISFVDAIGEKQIFKHKTLAEIIQGLRDLGYVLNDGADTALGAMVQAYKERKLIEDNEDIEYIGFFTDNENKIFASNNDIKKPTVEELIDALKLIIDELKTIYEDNNRLDLLATSIVWGMIAPIIFILKTNNYFLKLLHYYGFANATKSSTGKLILALDGHENDSRFSMQFGRIDSQARLGDAVSRSTFPILVDEVNLNEEKTGWLVNSIKSIVESKIARTKFSHSKASSPNDIPSLSCLIFTSHKNRRVYWLLA